MSGAAPSRARAIARAALVAVAVAGSIVAPRAALAAGPSPLADTEVSVTAEPATLQLTPGPATVTVTVDSVRPLSSVVMDFLYDESKLRVTKVELGPAFALGAIQSGAAGVTLEQAITFANVQGKLEGIGVYLLPGMGELPKGRNVLLTISLDALGSGTTQVAISKAKAQDDTATDLTVVGPAGGAKRPDEAAAAGPDPVLVAGLTAGVVLALFLLSLVSGAIPPRRLREPPFVLSLAFGILPVGALVAIVAFIVVNALPALEKPGLNGLLSAKFSSAFSLGGITGDWGLVPSAWGTLLITGLAIVLALPASVAMAIVATEFPAGPLGRVLRPLLGLFAGIPPIVYAVAGAVFVTVFVAPKFAGSLTRTDFRPEAIGVAAAQWPPADVPFSDTAFPWAPNVSGLPNSTLLGGILVALLVIPFMTPLIWDAMRNVPAAAREASFAMGANRWYTVRRVLVPAAMPGIVAAVSLATLKALGDVLIIALAVGWQAERPPQPAWDVLERTASLAATGANLLGNLQAGSGGACDNKGSQCAVGFAAAFVLLVAAGVVVLLTSVLESRLRRRQPA